MKHTLPPTQLVPTLARLRAGLMIALMIALTLATVTGVSSAQSRPMSTHEADASLHDDILNASAGSPIGRNIYVLDTAHHRVAIFDSNGNHLGQFDHGFSSPTGMTLDGSNNLYVKDGNYHCQADKFNSKGQFVLQFGACETQGLGLGIFDNIGSMAIDATGNVWVTSPDFYYMQKVDSSGNFLSIVCMANVGTGCSVPVTPFLVQPSGIAVDRSGNIYVTNIYQTTGYSVVKFNSNGVYLSTFGSSGSGDGQFTYPENLAIDSTGNIYVADTGNNRIEKFGPNGKYLSQFGSPGSGDGQFNMPVGLAFDPDGNVYVSDVGNDRIQKFDSHGTYLSQFGQGLLLGPNAVAVRK
jgi:tripartite motif-containing protein 71